MIFCPNSGQFGFFPLNFSQDGNSISRLGARRIHTTTARAPPEHLNSSACHPHGSQGQRHGTQSSLLMQGVATLLTLEELPPLMLGLAAALPPGEGELRLHSDRKSSLGNFAHFRLSHISRSTSPLRNNRVSRLAIYQSKLHQTRLPSSSSS